MGTKAQFYPTLYSDPTGASARVEISQYAFAKFIWHTTVSPLALVISEQSQRFVEVHEDVRSTTAGRTAFASLIWVMQWVLRFALGRRDVPGEDLHRQRHAGFAGRSYRRLDARMRARRAVPVARRVSSLFRFLGRRLSTNQYRELMARISIIGYVRAYGLRAWGTVFAERARLSCYDHGWWKTPHMSHTAGGLWDVQLPPN